MDADASYETSDKRIALAVRLSQLNVSHQSGGPFGAAVFNQAGRLLGVGVNRVVPHNCSAAHAEVMALATTQQRLQKFRLNEGASASRWRHRPAMLNVLWRIDLGRY